MTIAYNISCSPSNCNEESEKFGSICSFIENSQAVQGQTASMSVGLMNLSSYGMKEMSMSMSPIPDLLTVLQPVGNGW